MTHKSFTQGRRVSESGTIEDLRGTVVSDRFIDAAIEVSKAFTRSGVRHALVGGLAVGVRGYIRNTGDVDFLVGEEAFDHHGMMVSPKAGLPISFNGIQIDWVSMSEHERFTFEPFIELPVEGVVPVVPAHVLIVMKALAGRQKDLADMVELFKAGADVNVALNLAHSSRSKSLIREMYLKAEEEAEAE